MQPQPQSQPQPQMFPVIPSFPPTNLTTEQIQKFLDENKKLILAILDNQNLGKLSECAHYYQSSFIRYQAQLQKNLMYLAAIADSQPPIPTIPTQMAPHPAMQQGASFMQHPQAAVMAQQQGLFPPKMPMQFGSSNQVHDPQLSLQQQAIHGQMGIRPVGPGNGVHPLSAELLVGGGSGAPPPSSGLSNVRAGGKQDALNTSADTHGSTPSGHPGGDSEHVSAEGPSYTFSAMILFTTSVGYSFLFGQGTWPGADVIPCRSCGSSAVSTSFGTAAFADLARTASSPIFNRQAKEQRGHENGSRS